MQKFWPIVLLLLSSCTFRSPGKIRTQVRFPGMRTSASPQCLFVDILNSDLAQKVASVSDACWQPGTLSGLVWRAEGEVVSVPVEITPGKGQLVQVLTISGSNVSSATCHGMPEALAAQGSVYQYGMVKTDIYAGATIDVDYSPRPDGSPLTEGCVARGALQSIAVVPTPMTVTTSGVRQFHAMGTYQNGFTYELFDASWSSDSANALAADTGKITGMAQGTFHLTVQSGSVSTGQINGTVTGPNLYLADYNNAMVRQIAALDGKIRAFGGQPGDFSYGGDGGVAKEIAIGHPTAIATDAFGNIFFSDSPASAIRRIDADTGIITTYAGGNGVGNNGDGGPATAAELNGPNGITLNSQGDLFIADSGNNAIRIVHGPSVPALTGIIGTYSGSGHSYPYALTFDSSDNLYVAEFVGHTIAKVPSGGGSGVVKIGNGTPSCGTLPVSGSVALVSTYSSKSPAGLAWDSGNSKLYISEQGNQRVTAYDPAANSLVAFAGAATCSLLTWTDGATLFGFANAAGLAYQPGKLYVSDVGVAAIGVFSGSTINLFAGVLSSNGYNGDNRPAVGAQLNAVQQIWLGQ